MVADVTAACAWASSGSLETGRAVASNASASFELFSLKLARSFTAVDCECSARSAGTDPPPSAIAASGLSLAAPVASSQRPIQPVVCRCSGLAVHHAASDSKCDRLSAAKPICGRIASWPGVPQRHERLQRRVQTDRRRVRERDELVVGDGKRRSEIVIAAVVRDHRVQRVVAAGELHHDEHALEIRAGGRRARARARLRVVCSRTRPAHAAAPVTAAPPDNVRN